MKRLAQLRPFRTLRRFWRDRRGIAAAEFAVLASVLTVALLGGTELSRYTLMHQKMDRVSASVSNMVAQSSTMTTTDFNNMWGAAQQIAKPFELSGSNGVVIVSFIVAETDSNYRIQWQRKGAGTMSQASQLGVEGGLATLPSGVTMTKGDAMVAVEVYALYEAFVFPELIGTSIVYHRSFDQPRLTDVITVD
ncbi:MAG: pilus assembly protein [Rhodospirillaceae bacterium]|nr:pilus assembly protein [Rhodospirillaceae bacterium]